MHDRRPAEDRGPPQGDPEATLDHVGDVLAGPQLQPIAEAVGDLQGEALVGSLKTEAGTFRLEPGEVGWAIRLPRRRHHVGRRVDPRVVDG